MACSRRDFLRMTSGMALLSSAAAFDVNAAILGQESLRGRRLWPNFLSFNALWLQKENDRFRLDLNNLAHYKVACWILRDHHVNQYKAASMWLLRTAALVQSIVTQVAEHSPLIVHSGYRTVETNRRVGGVEHSMHLADSRGMFYAMDISSKAVSAEVLGKIVWHARQGGMGFYPSRGFIHMDVGLPRTWEKA